MILTKEQTQLRLSSDNNIANPSSPIFHDPQKIEVIIKNSIHNKEGRTVGSKNLTEEERVAVGVISSIVDAKTAGEMFNISPSHANKIKNGDLNSHDNRRYDVDLVNKIQDRLASTKLTIEERAAELLLNSLGLFGTEEVKEKMINSSPKEISTVIKDMSQVVRNISGGGKEDNNKGGKTNVKITLHAPRESREESFDVIEIGI